MPLGCPRQACGGIVAAVLSVARYIIMIARYVGFTTVIAIVVMMKVLMEVWEMSLPQPRRSVERAPR